MKINGLEKLRYSITNLPNETIVQFAVRGSPIVKMAITYEILVKHHIAQLKETTSSSAPEQVERNHLTALRAFLKSVGKFPSSPVGEELDDGFDVALKLHLQTAGLNARSQGDRKSLLFAWRKTFICLGEEPVKCHKGQRVLSSVAPEIQNPFERALKDGLKAAKVAPKAAALRAKTSTSAMSRWMRGALPNVRTVEAFGRLEAVLAMPSGKLLEAYRLATGRGLHAPTTVFGERLKRQKALVYRLREAEMTPQLFGEWSQFLEYKTASIESSIKRRKKSKWTLVEPLNTTVKPSKVCSRGRRVCPTASIVWQLLSAFFGFLRLPIEDGGFGVTTSESQTMAWLAVPRAIDDFLNFQTDRCDGLVHAGTKRFASFVMSITHPVHGYLVQMPEFQSKLPEHFASSGKWDRMCGDAMQVAASCLSDPHAISRNPSAPIRHLLDLHDPYVPVFVAMRKLRRIGDGALANSKQEAIARRDEFLLGLLISNPLRCKNLVTLTYKSDNTGNLYKNSNGKWRISISGGMFKNRGRVGSEVYDVPVASWLEPLLTNYVNHSRPVLRCGKQSEWLLLNSRGGRLDTLSRQVFRLTKLYVPGNQGFGPHAFRHLVATDWLTRNHNDFLTVAELLNDTIEVVMRNYAHLKKDAAFNRFEAFVQKRSENEMLGLLNT